MLSKPTIICLLIVTASYIASGATFQKGQSANILFLPMHIISSHKKSMMPLANRLADLGHNVTVFNGMFEAFPVKTVPGVTDVNLVVKTDVHFFNEQFVWKNGSDLMDTWEVPDLTSWHVFLTWIINAEVCTEVLKNDPVAFDSIANQHWDLIIFDMYFAPCAYVMISKAAPGTPYIPLSTSSLLPMLARHINLPLPISDMMDISADFDSRQFKHRLRNTFYWRVVDEVLERVLETKMRYSFAPHIPSSFTFADFERDISLAMSLYPRSFDMPRPNLNDVILFGDIDCSIQFPKPDGKGPSLDPQFDTFVSDPQSKGTIVAAFGHIVQWKKTKNETIQAFYQAFASMKHYRFIWQYNGPELPPVKNILMTSWLPQVQLLQHPRTLAFLSHMGLKSATEGVCTGLPFIALPVYAEQPFNTQMLITKRGFGSRLDKFQLTPENIRTAVLDAITRPNSEVYKRRVDASAQQMADKPIPELDLGVHWINFVLRHRPHLHIVRGNVRRFGTIRYYCLDVLCLPLVVLLLIGVVANKAVKSVFC